MKDTTRTDSIYNENDNSIEIPEWEELDYLDEYDPEEYSTRWQAIGTGRRLEYHVSSRHLTMDKCHSYFSSKKIHVVASGLQGEHQMKFFLVARKDGKHCLSEVTIDFSAKRSTLHVKSEDHFNLSAFINTINMRTLMSA